MHNDIILDFEDIPEIDMDLARELIILKAKDLGLEDEDLNDLDEVICKMLRIKDAEPFIFPS
jgi:hypothetical protein